MSQAPYTIDSEIEIAKGLAVRVGDAMDFLRPGDGWHEPGQYYEFMGFKRVGRATFILISTFILIRPERSGAGAFEGCDFEGDVSLIPFDEKARVNNLLKETPLGLAHVVSILMGSGAEIAPRIRAAQDWKALAASARPAPPALPRSSRL